MSNPETEIRNFFLKLISIVAGVLIFTFLIIAIQPFKQYPLANETITNVEMFLFPNPIMITIEVLIIIIGLIIAIYFWSKRHSGSVV